MFLAQQLLILCEKTPEGRRQNGNFQRGLRESFLFAGLMVDRKEARVNSRIESMCSQPDHSSERLFLHGRLSGEETDYQRPGSRDGLNRLSNWKEWIGERDEPPFRVLIIGDDSSRYSAAIRVLETCEAQVTAVATGAQAIEMMRHAHLDLVFTGLDVAGIDIFQLIRVAKDIFPETEIYILASPESIGEAVECMKKGAEGFVVKPDIREQLIIIAKRAKHRKSIRLLAYTDGLTSLFNRDTFNQFLLHECHRSARRGYSFALLLFDIDHFKEYNDLNGHLIGDVALIKLGRLLKQSTRASDIPARYGGDEFAVILTEITLAEALMRANRIRQLVSLTPFQHEKNISGSKLTVSLGLALYPEHGLSFAKLVRNADRALYQAKAEGRNRVCVFAEKNGA
jgi:diguanylate cyclase (GGDEF)-like protein